MITVINASSGMFKDTFVKLENEDHAFRIYVFYRSLRSQRIIIHINLVIAVLLAQVLFLVAAFGVKPQTSQVNNSVILIKFKFDFTKRHTYAIK